MEVLYSFNNVVCLAFLTTVQFYLAVSQEMFTIIRNPGRVLWTDLDQFRLPESKCSTYYCIVMNAYPDSFCHCKCSNFKATTFGFYSGSWTCLDNIEVRKQTGNLCKYKFQAEQERYPLKILKQGTQYYAILPSTECSVDQMTSRHFTCDGRWSGIDSQSSSKWFSIQYGRKSADGHIYRVKIGSNISSELLGRIISLSIACPQEHSCLLFKLQGTFQCAENVTSIIPSSSSAIPSPTTRSSVSTPTTIATSGPNATANPNDNRNKDKAKTSGGSSTVVGVVVTLVIIVVIVIVIAVYVYRKRKRGESVWLVDYISSRVRKPKSTQPKKKTVDEAQEEPEYAEIPEEQRRNQPVDQAGGIYSYAFDDPQTAYIASQPAPYNKLVHNRQEPDQEGAIYSSADDGPVYNVLERPPAENDIAMDEGPPFEDLEPEYHVLEGPGTTDETTDSPFNGNSDVRASVGTANPSQPQIGHEVTKERRRPPSPPRKI